MSKEKAAQQDKQSKQSVNKRVEAKEPLMETAVVHPTSRLQKANLSPQEAKTLQRTIGNQALQRLTIQRKMTLGPVGDKYEQEADAVAKQVMGKLNTSQPQAVQRQEEEEDVQMKPMAQRQEEEEELQMKPLLQRQEEEEEVQMKPSSTLAEGEISSDIESQIQSAKGGGRPLATNTQTSMGQAFNADFSGIKIHTDSRSDHLNQSIQARAFTTGQDIFFRQGEYNPNSSGGQELLAHELTHTIQQSGTQTPLAKKEAIQRMTITPVATPRIQRVGVPQVGDDPPELKDLNARRYFSKLPLGKKRTIRKAVLSDKKAAALAKIPLLNRPTDNETDKVLKAFQDAVDTTTKDFPAYIATWNDVSLNAIAKRFDLINELFNQLKEGIEPKVRQLYKRLDTELEKRIKTLGAKVGKIPGDEIRRKFAAALKGMPGFKSLLTQIKARGTVREEKNLMGVHTTTWKDNGNLTAKIEEVAAEATFAEKRTDIDNGNFSKKVQEADNFFRKLVEAEELKKIPRPTIKVHLETAYDVDPRPRNVGGGFGGYQTGTEIHVGQDVFREVLIHEIGHYVENNLPTDKWQDIHLLMRARHGEAGGDGKLEAGQGARYKGAYPVTGGYTSRAYGGEGSTEVMSMTVQYLSQQANIENQLDNDPQQAAVIIRALRPREYASYNPLRAFDELLP